MDNDIENWAVFEPFQIRVKDSESIRADDPDLQRALRLHGLKFKKQGEEKIGSLRRSGDFVFRNISLFQKRFEPC
jgi:hypothetical protein